LGIKQSELRKVKVPWFPLPTQRKIASILSAYDDLIENNTRRIAILEEMAQAIYREWFVNFRFPGHENVKLVQSTLGMIPEGWKTDKLSAIADVNARSIKNDLVPDCINYIDIASVSTGRINEIRPMTFAEAPGRARRIVRHGDVIWSTVRPNRRSYCIVIDPVPDTVASTGFAVLSPSSVPFSYLYYAVTTDDFASYLVNHATGSAYPAVNSKDFSDAELLLPSKHLLERFHALVGETLLLANRLQLKNQNLRMTRDLLLPKLISGQLDVEDIDIDFGITAEEIGEAIAKPMPTGKQVDRKPAVRATAEVDGASTTSISNTHEAIPVDELDVDQVMAEFRQQARRLGTTTRGELLKAVSQELGYKRLGHSIEEVLKGHLRAAIRRKIIAADGELVCLHTPSMETYERDELVDAFHSVMRKNVSYEREDVIRALANHLGFRRISDTVREPIKSAINAAIRRGVLRYQGELIWRAV
jgi:Type I restriction modification DNA specificity domain